MTAAWAACREGQQTAWTAWDVGTVVEDGDCKGGMVVGHVAAAVGVIGCCRAYSDLCGCCCC